MSDWRPAILVAVSVLLANVTASSRPPAVSPVPRAIVALFDGAHDRSSRFTRVHRLAELPLNHLGLTVRYHDIRGGLPTDTDLAGARGVLTWFEDDSMPDPRAYLQWMDALVDRKLPIAIMGRLGVLRDERGLETPLPEINRVLTRLGWRLDGGWLTTTYGAHFAVQDATLFGFERPLPAVAPPYARVQATASDARVALSLAVNGRPWADSDLAIISPRGAWIAEGYSLFVDRTETDEYRQWYLNPFEFFREVFGTDDVPKADTTTVSGRRIYYSHVDGDGWRNVTRIEPYRSRHTMSARVLLDEVVRKFSDLPVSVSAIAGDLDPAWHGSAESVAVAREIYREPHVEPSIHTYSHPLDWEAFDPDSSAAKKATDTTKARSYTTRPFALTTEVDEAAAFVNALLPPGKRVGLLQWSGDTRVFERVVAQARATGLANINGGDSRFDPDFPSLAWVQPLGMSVGRERQIYASTSNENTYTHNWTDRFFAFAFLPATVRNTGSPRRLKPFNIYYNVYSAEQLASLNALLANLTYARSLSLAPIETSRFSRIAEGFYSAAFDRVGPRMWRVRDRGALHTVRFDRAELDGVDFDRSQGVVGQRHDLGSLYVALDESEPTPVIALKRLPSAEATPREPLAYLVDARWRVLQVRREYRSVRFLTEGYGPGEFTWQWPFGTRVRVRWRAESGRSGEVDAAADADGLLTVRLPQLTRDRVEVTLTAAEPANGH